MARNCVNKKAQTWFKKIKWSFFSPAIICQKILLHK